MASLDDHTRMARFESMRKGPNQTRRTSRNKKLFIVHKDLQKQCDKVVKSVDFDGRVRIAELSRQQKFVERKKESLAALQQKCAANRNQTRALLECLERTHRQRENTFSVEFDARCGIILRTSTDPRTLETDFIRRLGRVALPGTINRGARRTVAGGQRERADTEVK